ncbi:MAG: BadF/BadG/BcrA/BcrD ATPase family protein, partial [Halanaerobiales bacterium]
ATEMSQLFCKFLEIEYVENIIQKVYVEKMSRKDLANLAKLVFIAAVDGDVVATEIVRKAGINLAEQVLTIVRELEMDNSRIVIPLVGGVFKGKNEILFNAIKEELDRALKTEIELIDPILQPSAGGLLIALDSIGIIINTEIINNLKKGEKIC